MAGKIKPERAAKPKPAKMRAAATTSGACLCGGVEIEIDTPVFWAWHHHSASTRLAHGAAYATYVGCWKSKVRIAKGEALVAGLAWRAAGRTSVPETADGACPFLKGSRCQIYEGRPFGCRTHFCQAAGGMYPRKHVADLIQRLAALDERLGGDGARPLTGIVDEVLAKKTK